MLTLGVAIFLLENFKSIVGQTPLHSTDSISLLKQRRKNAQKRLHDAGWQCNCLEVCKSYFLADIKNPCQIILDFVDGRGTAHPDTVFKMQVKTSVVHVDASDDGVVIIG